MKERPSVSKHSLEKEVEACIALGWDVEFKRFRTKVTVRQVVVRKVGQKVHSMAYALDLLETWADGVLNARLRLEKYLGTV